MSPDRLFQSNSLFQSISLKSSAWSPNPPSVSSSVSEAVCDACKFSRDSKLKKRIGYMHEHRDSDSSAYTINDPFFSLVILQRTAKAPPQLDLSSVPAPASSTSSNHGFDIKLPFPDWERSPFFSSPLLPSSTQ
ncbi:hypothetical protein CDL15_Pgr012743 [Punica granatum]|uniref:Uncharacterized protein n=1 Tax=Punica granatum TaxID=22663 RepID=A0A218XFZ7_PUNGR|nr:hypothetical protein CDL15_Pgr012743 [Punica granatum]